MCLSDEGRIDLKGKEVSITAWKVFAVHDDKSLHSPFWGSIRWDKDKRVIHAPYPPYNRIGLGFFAFFTRSDAESFAKKLNLQYSRPGTLLAKKVKLENVIFFGFDDNFDDPCAVAEICTLLES